MSLIQGYSSDEDDAKLQVNDVFGLSAVPSTKKVRLDEPAQPKITANAAPDVLAEVTIRNALICERVTYAASSAL